MLGRPRQEWSPDTASLTEGRGWRDRRLSEARATSCLQSSRVLARQSARSRLSHITQCAVGTIVRHAILRHGIEAPPPEPISFATDWLRRCYVKARPSRTLVNYWATEVPRLRRFTPRSTSRRCASSLFHGRETCDELRQAVEEYLAMRRSLGFKLNDAGRSLLDFASFMHRHRAPYITQALALTWAQQPRNAEPAYWAQRLGFVRGFARYRSATDARTQIPPAGLLPFRPKRARPYLYSDKEIQHLLGATVQHAALAAPP